MTGLDLFYPSGPRHTPQRRNFAGRPALGWRMDIWRRATSIACLAGLVALVGGSAGPATMSALAAAPGALVAHLTWQPAASGVQAVAAAGDDVLLENVGAVPSAGTLIDTRTGRRRSIPAPAGCVFDYGPEPLSTRWLLRTCGTEAHPDIRLLSLATGRWRDLGTPAGVRREVTACAADFGCALGATSVGADWIGWTFECANEHCLRSDFPSGFTSIATGRWRPPGTGPRVIDDLDAPALTVPVCAPLTVPAGSSLIAEGRFVALSAAGDGPSYLERCGSRRRIPIGTGPVTGNAAVVVAAGAGRLNGVLLPSLRRVVIPLPRSIAATATTFVISGRTLFADDDSLLWEAPLPPGLGAG